MGVVIEIFVKCPWGPTRMNVTDRALYDPVTGPRYAHCISATVIQVGPLRYFIHISITTPIVFALKNYYR